MWIPKTESEIVNAVTTGALEESSIFDAKKELSAKNAEIAKDIAAMANDGGVIIYGIDEDTNGYPTILNPVPLANQPERITSIVQTSISEPPRIVIHTIPTSSDASIGYIVVIIPPSDRSPHMVVVKGDNRYYGRTATGNRLLSEAEVARLYERRQRLEVDREAILSSEIEGSPYPSDPDFGFLHLIVQPLFRDDNILQRAVKEGQTPQGVLFDLLNEVSGNDVFIGNYSPDFYVQSQWRHSDNGFMTEMGARRNPNDPRWLADALNLQIDLDGTGHLFCGRAAERNDGLLAIFSSIIAGNTVRFIMLLGKLYRRAKYNGMVDRV